jgi:D-alanyl-D-alanine carboxypeptidase
MSRAWVTLAQCSLLAGSLLWFEPLFATDKDLSASVHQLVKDAVAQGPLASLTVSIRKDGTTLLTDSLGSADLEQGVPAKPGGVYAIGSISKSLTAYCILTLVHQGKLQLTSRLQDLLPDYTGPGRSATLLHLLTHTAGIPDYAGDSAPDRIADPARHYTEQQVVELFSHEAPAFAPGTHWQYSNSGYYLLGLVIEKVTGRPYPEAVQDLLLSPLDVRGIEMDYRAPLMKERVRGYTLDSHRALVNASSYDAIIAWSAGGYRATADELTLYIDRLFSGRVPAAVHSLMFTEARLSDGTPISYRPIALFHGSLQGHEEYYHAGGIWGFAAHVAYFPGDRLAISLLTNTDNGAVSLAHLNAQVARLALRLATPRVVDLSLSESEGRRLTGIYCLRQSMSGNAQIHIAYEHGSLVASGDWPADWSSGARLRYQGAVRFVPTSDDDLVVDFDQTPERPTTLRLDTNRIGTLSASLCPSHERESQ